MQCKNCGALLNDNSQVCTMCGMTVEKVEESPVTVISPIQNNGNISEEVAMFNNPINDYEPKKSKKGIIAIIITVVVLVVGLLGFSFYLIRSPRMVFNKFIDKMYKQVETTFVDFDTMKGSFSLQTSISPNEEENIIIDILNNVFVSVDYEIDANNKTVLTQINTKYDNEKLINLDVYLKDTKGYVLLRDIYSKYLSVDLDENVDSIFESSKNVEEEKVILKELKTAITKSLKNSYLKKETEVISVDRKNIKTTKNILELDNINKIAIDVLKYLKSSDEFIKSASKVSNLTEADILLELDDSIDYLENDPIEPTNDNTQLSIYTKGLMKEFVRIELSVDVDGEKRYLRITEESKNNFKVEYYNNEMSITGNLKFTENNGKNSIDLSLTDKISGMTFGLNITNSVEYNKELSSVNVSDNVDSYDLTEEDYNEIATNLMESPGIQRLIEKLAYIMELPLNDAKESANKRSVEGYMKAYEVAYYEKWLETGIQPTELDKLDVEYSDNRVTCTNITMNSDGKFSALCEIDGKKYSYIDGLIAN